MDRFDVQKLWGKIDLVIVLPMALPPVAALILEIFAGVNSLFPGDNNNTLLPDALGLSLMAGLAALWAVARIRIRSWTLMKLDIVGRAWVSLLLLYAFAFMGYAPVLLIFLISELAGVAHQAWVCRQHSQW